MISLQKIGDSAVKFVFTDSDHYLYGNGEIDVPVNSLLLVIDESDMVTFKKLSGDPFLSFRADNSNLGTKAAIEQFYKDNMVGSTGGGSESGITPSEVQEMIDESISGKADTSAVTAVANDVSTLSGQVATKVATSDFNAYSAATDSRLAEDEEVTAAALNDLDENKQDTLVYYQEDTEGDGYANIDIQTDDGEGNTAEYWFNVGSGTVDLGAFTQYDDGEGNVTNNNTQINLFSSDFTISSDSNDGENSSVFIVTPTSITLDSTSAMLNGEPIATEDYVDAAVSGKADTSAVTAAINAATSGKVDTSAITTTITSGSTDAEIPTAKAVYDAIPTGGTGAAYSAGTNISIDTGNTISCTLNLRNGTGQNSITGVNGQALGNASIAWGYNASVKKDESVVIGANSTVKEIRSIAVGQTVNIEGPWSCGFGINNNSYGRANAIFGINNTTRNGQEAAFGTYNNSVTGSTESGQTLFSVGNGTSSLAHNAFEIRQNGDIYVNDGTNDVRLQDTILALGGLKFAQVTQAQYDALVSGGTVDSSTIYFITNVVS